MKKNFYVILSILGIIGGFLTFTGMMTDERTFFNYQELGEFSVFVGAAALFGSILFYKYFVHSKKITMATILYSIIHIFYSLYYRVAGERWSKKVNFGLGGDEERLIYDETIINDFYNPLLYGTMLFAIFYLLFSIYCIYKIKSSNIKKDNKEIPTDNQETMINELKERIKNLENK